MKVYQAAPHPIYFCARTHILTGPERLDLVLQHALRVVVNLWHSVDPEMERLVDVYAHIPMRDGKRVDPAAVEDAVECVVDCVASGASVLVHCYGGRNRSGLVVAMAMVVLDGITGREACARVRAARPGALANVTFRSLCEAM